MSINVNVTGNPVKIHRGKMVTINPDHAKDEFQKRRRMRMEQVRQQSKDIAETVRNKVRNEQNKHLSDMEKQGENELKKWQARKLLQLQQQYHECLKDIGLGHSEAILEEESDYAMESRKESFDQTAKERGFRAAEKLHHQKQREISDKSAGIQKRNYVHAIENTRAKLIANLHKKTKSRSPFKKKKRKVCTDINISSRLSGGSDSGSDVPEIFNFSDSSCSSGAMKEVTKKSTRKDPTPVSPQTVDNISRDKFSIQSAKEKVHKHGISSPTRRQIEENFKRNNINYCVDTRISDRIKSRTVLSDTCEPHTCDTSPVIVPKCREAVTIHSERQSPPRIPPKQFSPPASPKLKAVCSEDEDPCSEKCKGFHSKNSKNDTEEIPNKPTVSLRTGAPESSNKLKSSELSTGSLNKVQYYDHKNRFSKQYVADNLSVQRIPEESIEVCPSSRSEAEFQETMYKRDQDAQIRGQKALQKEKVHRDYREMMQKMPGLQKQERMASIPTKKPAFHMSEDRLKEREKKKQNEMENTYEKLFPKARVITIPPNNRGKLPTSTNLLPFQTIDLSDKQPSVNVGTWDIDVKPKSPLKFPPSHAESNLIKETTQKILGNSTSSRKEAAERRENLQDMLRSLQSQRDKLARELAALPESTNRQKLFSELGHIDKLIQIGQNVDKEPQTSSGNRPSRSRRKQDKFKYYSKASSSSASPSRLETVREESEKRPDPRKISKYHVRCTSGSSSSPSPPKFVNKPPKRKLVRPQLILQNTSTQTTPTVRKEKAAVKQDVTEKQPTSSKPSTAVNLNSNRKELGPCECYLQKGSGDSELCEIVIKITEDGKPEVCIGSAKGRDNQIIVKTNEQEIPASKPPTQISLTEKPTKPEVQEKPKPKPKSPPTRQKIIDKPKIEKKVEKPKAVVDKDEKTKHSDSKQKSGSSWREYLSQNSTTSTSYMSPPDFTSNKADQVHSRQSQFSKITTDGSTQKPIRQLMNILKDKPQQINLQENSTISSNQSSNVKLNGRFVEPYLRCCIKKLLTMSRGSIDDLAVSSVSEISTPGSSIINIQSNISMQQLDDFMKHFNLNMSELQELLNFSPDDSSRHYNTAESLPMSTPVDRGTSPNCMNFCGTGNSQDLTGSNFDSYANQSFPGVLAVYNKLAENCAKKIENLAAMIEKVRLEKLNMLQSPGSGSDKENSTKYLDLPAKLKNQKLGGNTSPSSNSEAERKKLHSPSELTNPKSGSNTSPSSNSTADQRELDQQLLLIDFDLAEHLKKMTPHEIKEQFPLNNDANKVGSLSKELEESQNSIDKELMGRYKNLLESYKSSSKAAMDENCNCSSPNVTNDNNDDTNKDASFIPLLVDIPRLPKLEVSSITNGLHRSNGKSKPPPSKGISIAKRFNNDLNIAPHELSTIAEAESIMSSRLHKSKSPESRASSVGTSSEKKLNKDLVSSPKSQPKAKVTTLTTDAFKLQDSSSSSLLSLPDILAELMKNVSGESEKATCTSGGKSPKKNDQAVPVRILEARSESSSDIENMETMLKSLGMGWAITTLRKTQEALALTSSSSSIDISAARKEMKLSDTSSPSDISIRDALGKQLLSKLSSTNDSSGSYQFLKELQDLSAIYGSELGQEKTTGRTSTPVQSIKSGDKSKSNGKPPVTLSTESEASCECAPFYSLNESSIKSKNSSKDD